MSWHWQLRIGPVLDSLRQEQAGKAARVRVSAAMGGRPLYLAQCVTCRSWLHDV